jgi:NADAR domain
LTAAGGLPRSITSRPRSSPAPATPTSLLATGDEEIVEDTSTDHYWGRGRTGTGKNMLGRILMRTRTQLRARLSEL